jgi:hypothetical protein
LTDTIQGTSPLKDACVRKGKPLRAASDLPDDVRERLDALFRVTRFRTRWRASTLIGSRARAG